ncbi:MULTISPECIES: IclR family transcriptional regulator [unclassified Haladaptatus]|uniref:IclR family transcriptional regulator n=1 Tax=unclassified Haladaptatus TaxID=2622732 RepID=UPI00209BC97B|nr:MULTISPECIES: IclR family transcriptional regulator [unclassified Haladaptatus]MCO8243718.1 IclR family transcriptional regulator [Haladaptatus sp. AB643]MCO8255127.1 IclR family transcriptional regulator [Haladaptatus sp. AB618]
MNVDGRCPVNATKTSFTLLETLAADGPLGVTELASRIDTTKGTVHNHLTTLRSLGYVKQVDGRYDLTLRSLATGERTRDRMQLFRVAKPYLDNLTKTTGEYAGLYVGETGCATRVYHATCSDSWSPSSVNGDQVPLHATAAGKAILSSMSDDRVEDCIRHHGLDRYTDGTITDASRLFEQLRKVRDDGVAYSRGERIEDVNGVAAPIRGGDTDGRAAICVVGPDEVLHGRHFEEDVTGQVFSTAKKIELDLRSA